MKNGWILVLSLALVACGSTSEESPDEGSPVSDTLSEEGGGEEGGTGESPDAQETGGDATSGEEGGADTEAGEGGQEGGSDDGGTAGSEDGETEGGEGEGEGDAEAGEGGETGVVTAPVGTWLLWTDTPGCGDSDLFSNRFSDAKYAVLTVTADGEASVLFHDASYEQFRTYVLPTVEVAEGEAYVVSVDESVEEPEGSGCTINRQMTLSLNFTLDAWAGTIEFSELKKGGGCFSDGCEGVLDVKTQELGNPVNPLYWEGVFPYAYENAADGISEVGDMLFYAVPDQPYYFELDITTVGASLQTIRGKKYIGGQSDKLFGRAAELSFSSCPDAYNADIWDLSLTIEAGPGFGGTLEHRTSTYGESCEEEVTSSLGTLSSP